MFILASGNPFISAYLQSDFFGKGIFLGLLILSAISWTVLLHKVWLLKKVKKLSAEFERQFSEKEPLSLQFNKPLRGRLLEIPHPFFAIYKAFKTKALAIISRNHFFLSGSSDFAPSDLDLLASEINVSIGKQLKNLEKNLFVLSTVVSLGPFIGLLGTVWGILMSFSHMQNKASVANDSMLSGLSLALATTVIGLVVAIPALIGFNYIKNALKDFRRDMEDFGHVLLSSIKLHYQKGEHAVKNASIDG